MLLCVDIGNTNIVFAGYEGESLSFTARAATDLSRTGDQYAAELYSLLTLYGVSPGEIHGCIIGSVVPGLTGQLRSACTKVLSFTPLILDGSLDTGLVIRIDNPRETGADLIAAAVAAKARYPLPCILIDMGTATTMTVLDSTGTFLGGAILPGMRLSLEALVGRASLLTAVALEAPDRCIGASTRECLQSGAVYGSAAMIEGLCERFAKELGTPSSIVATGGLAGLVVPHCRIPIILDETLLTDGLRMIYERNMQRNSGKE